MNNVYTHLFTPENHIDYKHFSHSLVSNRHLRHFLRVIDGMIINNGRNTVMEGYVLKAGEASLNPVAKLGLEVVEDHLKYKDDDEKNPSSLKTAILDALHSKIPTESPGTCHHFARPPTNSFCPI